jgi:hypothetical protein
MSKLSVSVLIASLLFGTIAIVFGIGPRIQAGLAAQLAGPSLSIPLKIPAEPNSTVTIPVQFAANGSQISSAVFGIDYNQTWLSYDSSVPNSIVFNLPPDFVGSCTPDTADLNGELKCFIMDPVVPLASLPNSVVLSVILRTKNPSIPTEARVGFSQDSPPPSFGDNQGQSVPGSTIDGSVQIGEEGIPTLTPWQYIPVVLRNFLIIPSVTPTPSATITPTGTVSPTPSVTPPGCSDKIENGGFEKNSDWEILNTEYWAEYSTEQAHNGNRSMRTGIIKTRENIYSYSSVRQMVTIPSNADSAELTLWIYQISEDIYAPHTLPRLTLGAPFGKELFSSDFQYILILDSSDNLIDVLYNDLANTLTWKEKVYDLIDYAGWTIQLEFGTYNTGLGDVSAMYVDDVSLEVCR